MGLRNFLMRESNRVHFSGEPTEVVMATKTDGGDEYAASDYAYVPDANKPSTWKIRLKEYVNGKKQETSAQVGRAAAALGKGFRGNKAQIPSGDLAGVVARVRAAWKRQNPGAKSDAMPEGIKMTADFAITDPVAGIVRRWTKLFTTGEYPDKDFAMTPDEMQRAVDAFAPVPIDLQHTSTVLDGHLGRLESVECSDDGNDLYGVVAIPQWLDALLDGTKRAVSTTWDTATKTLLGLAIVHDGRVDDATMMAAFEKANQLPELPAAPVTMAAFQGALDEGDHLRVLSAFLNRADDEVALATLVDFANRHDTREGQSTIQSLHDTASRYGAVCTDPNAKMASQHESDAMQQIHDITTEHGASCSDNSKTPSWYFSKAEVETRQPAAAPPEEKNGMNLEEFLRKYFSQGEGAESTGEGAPAAAGAATPPAAAAQAAPVVVNNAADPEKVRLQEEVNRLRAQNIQQAATTFADRVIHEGRALPCEREALIMNYTQSAVDDMRLPGTVQFADGKTGTRVEILEATLAARKANMLDSERIPSELVGLVNIQRTSVPAAEMGSTDRATIDQMLAATPTGQAVIAGRNGNQN